MKFVASSLLALGLLAAPAFANEPPADDAATTAPATVEAAAPEAVDKDAEYLAWLDEETCKTEPLTGSRVRKHRVCHTNREWQLIEDSNAHKMRDLGRGGRPQEGM